jgi:hypothetical protein
LKAAGFLKGKKPIKVSCFIYECGNYAPRPLPALSSLYDQSHRHFTPCCIH